MSPTRQKNKQTEAAEKPRPFVCTESAFRSLAAIKVVDCNSAFDRLFNRHDETAFIR